MLIAFSLIFLKFYNDYIIIFPIIKSWTLYSETCVELDFRCTRLLLGIYLVVLSVFYQKQVITSNVFSNQSVLGCLKH